MNRGGVIDYHFLYSFHGDGTRDWFNEEDHRRYIRLYIRTVYRTVYKDGWIDLMKRIGWYIRLYTRTVYKTIYKDGWIDSMKRIGRYIRLYTRMVYKTIYKDGWIDSMKRIAFRWRWWWYGGGWRSGWYIGYYIRTDGSIQWRGSLSGVNSIGFIIIIVSYTLWETPIVIEKKVERYSRRDQESIGPIYIT
jgi:hypothetical protein